MTECLLNVEVDLCAFSMNLFTLKKHFGGKPSTKLWYFGGEGGGEVYELALESWGWGGWVHIDTACYWKGEACLDAGKIDTKNNSDTSFL